MYVRFAREGEGLANRVVTSYTTDFPVSPWTPQERGLAQLVTRTPNPNTWDGPFATVSPWPALVTK